MTSEAAPLYPKSGRNLDLEDHAIDGRFRPRDSAAPAADGGVLGQVTERVDPVRGHEVEVFQQSGRGRLHESGRLIDVVLDLDGDALVAVGLVASLGDALSQRPLVAREGDE